MSVKPDQLSKYMQLRQLAMLLRNHETEARLIPSIWRECKRAFGRLFQQNPLRERDTHRTRASN